MDKKQLTSKLLLAGGIAEILIAVLHFLMPLQFSQTGEFANLSDDYRNFVLLATLAIGLCVGIYGILCIYFSRKLLKGEATAWVFGISQAALWSGRTILELILPVKIPLFFLSNPTILVLPLSILLTLLFLVPLITFREELSVIDNKQ
jgi:hypothetical protein